MMTQRRKRPHSWPKNVRPPTPISVDGNQRRPALDENEKEKSEDNEKEIKVYYEPAKRDWLYINTYICNFKLNSSFQSAIG